MSTDESGELRAALTRRAVRLAAQRRRRRATLGAVGGVAVLVAVVLAGVLLRGGVDTAANLPGAVAGRGACTTALEVTAAPEIAPVLTELADAFVAQGTSGGDCAEVVVTPAASADVAQALVEGTAADASGAHVWVPESSVWVREVEASPDGAALLRPDRPSIARSPTVLGMPRPMAEALGWPNAPLGWSQLLPLAQDPETWARNAHPEWGPFRVGLPDPQRSAAGLHAVLSVGAAQSGVWTDALSTDGLRDEAVRVTLLTLERGTAGRRASVDEQLAALRTADDADQPLGALSALPLAERDIWRYNAGLDLGTPPEVPLVALYPPEGAVVFDHPYVELARTGDEGQIQQAAAFRDFLLGTQAQDLLRERGYRGADDVPGDVLNTDDNLDPDRSGADSAPPDGRAVAAVQEGWEALSRRFTTLAVMDVSGSMAEPVPGTGRSLMEFVIESAGRGAALFADDSNLGLWEFSTELPGGEQGGDYRELVPIGPVGEDLGGGTRRDALRGALSQMQPTNDTSLYDTILAAYIRARDATVPGRPTAVALFTDGRSDGDDLSLEGLLDRLRQEQDPARPVRMALIAYGENPPTGELTQVADLIGGRVFTPSSPEGITQVFLDVLTSP